MKDANLSVRILRFRVVTPLAFQWTPLEKYCGSDARSVMNAIFLNIGYDSCKHQALERVGRSYEAAKLVKMLEADQIFYEESGGGVTLSGGEVMGVETGCSIFLSTVLANRSQYFVLYSNIFD